MAKDGNNLMRNVLTQLAGNLTDAGGTALVSAYNLPAGLTLGAAQDPEIHSLVIRGAEGADCIPFTIKVKVPVGLK